jgi:hypothetical protein
MNEHEAEAVSRIYSELGAALSQIQSLSDEVRRLMARAQEARMADLGLPLGVCAVFQEGPIPSGWEEVGRDPVTGLRVVQFRKSDPITYADVRAILIHDAAVAVETLDEDELE